MFRAMGQSQFRQIARMDGRGNEDRMVRVHLVIQNVGGMNSRQRVETRPGQLPGRMMQRHRLDDGPGQSPNAQNAAAQFRVAGVGESCISASQ